MLRRVYMLFPTRASALGAVDELIGLGVSRRNLHTIARPGVDLAGLPPATVRQTTDLGARIEQLAWNTNLVVFFIALAVLSASLFAGTLAVAAVSIAVMLASVIGGSYFASHVPHTHLEACRQAIGHGEILLLVDVPRWQIPKVSRAVHARRADMELGGVGWTLPGL